MELDAARGIALLMMILFHTLFDLSFFGIFPVNVSSGFWRYFGLGTASLFLLIAGISLSLSHARVVQAAPALSPAGIWAYYIRRGAMIGACGLLVTLATFLYLGDGFIVFGILHLIGVSTLIAPMFFRFGRNTILIGAAVIAAGIGLSLAAIDGPAWLIPLGIHPAFFRSVDYVPIFPWTGVMLAGMGLGMTIYPEGRRAFALPRFLRQAAALPAIPGRHSLLIYLAHQPVILLVLQLVTGTPIFW